MAITEDARHRLYQRLEEVLGNEEATTLMEQFGHVSWTDLATKRDVDQFAVATKRDLDQFAAAAKHDLDNLANVLRVEFERGLRMQTFALFAANSTLVALVLAAAKLV